MRPKEEPQMRYYARLTGSTASTPPRYTITESIGYYEPMEALRGSDGQISFFLFSTADSGHVAFTRPALRLEGRSSLNLTGLKMVFADGGITGYAYGYPLERTTYGKEGRRNPFHKYRHDCFLFVLHYSAPEEAEGHPCIPDGLEMLVMRGAKASRPSYIGQLAAGGFDGDLEFCRKTVEAGSGKHVR
ncbi:MAG: hypothetical protein NC116_09025 [Clostridium sp.]|nr:hypothetical protein [Bacteroidales bacterium]MCM1510842.1 hypothetical protein [Clostridium sp.]